jgi:hypothetical protein
MDVVAFNTNPGANCFVLLEKQARLPRLAIDVQFIQSSECKRAATTNTFYCDPE